MVKRFASTHRGSPGDTTNLASQNLDPIVESSVNIYKVGHSSCDTPGYPAFRRTLATQGTVSGRNIGVLSRVARRRPITHDMAALRHAGNGRNGRNGRNGGNDGNDVNDGSKLDQWTSSWSCQAALSQ